MPHRCFRQIGLLGLPLILVSCGALHQVQSMLRDVQPVQRELLKAGYGDIRVSVVNNLSANETFLTVNVVNSPLRTLPAAQRNAEALEIARLAYKSYPSASTLRSVSVTFSIHRSYLFGMFNYDNSADGVTFEISQLTADSPALEQF